MSEKVNFLTVMLSKDYTEEDARFIMQAIGMIQGVMKVEWNIVASDAIVIEERTKREFLRKILKALS